MLPVSFDHIGLSELFVLVLVYCQLISHIHCCLNGRHAMIVAHAHRSVSRPPVVAIPSRHLVGIPGASIARAIFGRGLLVIGGIGGGGALAVSVVTSGHKLYHSNTRAG